MSAVKVRTDDVFAVMLTDFLRASDDAQRRATRSVMADYLSDSSLDDDDVAIIRNGKPIYDWLLLALKLTKKKSHNRFVSSVFKDRVKSLCDSVYRNRMSRKVNPEGEFDERGRWYPSHREEASGDVRCVRAPSVLHRYSYMLRARTRQHCRHLVVRCLLGFDVPEDVRRAAQTSRDELFSLLSL